MTADNILDLSDEQNQRFIGSVLCVLCETSPITIDLRDIKKYWDGEVFRLSYDMAHDVEGESGSITFQLKEKPND